MQTRNVYWFTITLLVYTILLAPSDNQTNPYSYFDNEYTQWKIGQLYDNQRSLFQMKSQQDYLSFKTKNIILEVPSTVNDSERYKSKLGTRLVYYLTNKYQGAPVAESFLQDPFYISSYKLDNNLNIYVQKGFSITFSLKPGIQKAEIVDIIPSHEDILPWLCTKETLIKKPACFEEKYETDNKNVSIVVNIKIFPKTIGKHNFKLYVLTKVNGSNYVIVTIPGHFSVSNNSKFLIFCYQSMFRISKSSKTYRYLWLKNEDKKMLEVTDVVSFGNNLKLSYPLEFEPNEFKDQHIPLEAKKVIEDSEKRDFWLVPARNERPILELIFNRHTDDEKTGHEELDWVLLQNNIVRIMIDRNEYLYGLTTFFADSHKFWEHDFINLGLFTSKNVYHEADLYISNKTHYPVILNNIITLWENKDFDVHIASYYRHQIALPFYKSKFKIVKLLVKYKGNQNFSILRGRVKIQTNIYNQVYEEYLSFYAVYDKNILTYKKQNHDNLITDNQLSFELQFTQRTGSLYNVEKVSINGAYNSTRAFTLIPVKIKSLRSGETTHLLTVNFEKDSTGIEKYNEQLIFTLKSFESIISKRITFYYNKLICSAANIPYAFKSCNEPNLLSFGYLREKKKKSTKRWIIKNPSPLKQKITSFKVHNMSKLFSYKLNVSKYSAKLGEKNLIISINLDQINEHHSNIILGKGDRIHIEVSISLSSTFKTLERFVKHASEITINTNNGVAYTLKLDYGYIRGKISVKSKNIMVDFPFPGPLPRYIIKAYSSYLVPIEIEDIKRINDENNLISINAFSNLISPKSRSLVVEFTIDPYLLLNSAENLISQTAEDKNSICLRDIDKYHNGIIVWNKLKTLNAFKINAEIVMTTQIGTKIRVKVQGSLRPPDLLPNPLFLGYNILDGANIHDLVMKNPYNEPMEMKLFLAPQQFLNIDKIDREIIEQIKLHEINYVDNVICMGNKQLIPETLKFFINHLYFDNLEFINHPSAATISNQVCFKMPEKSAETEILYKKLVTVSNFFFEFTHYKNKENFLKENTIIINDIERYTVEEPIFVKKPVWIDRLKNYIIKTLGIRSSPRKENNKKNINQEFGFFNLNHIRNVTNYIQKKEVHLDPKIMHQTFVIRPKKTLNLKQAIILRPTAKNNIQNDKNVDIFLILKNNITGIYSVPIKYLTVLAKLSAGSERIPNTGSKLIFNVDHIRYFDRESFYERRMQVRRLVKEDFYFENKGVNPIYVRNITIGDAKVQEPCLQLLEFRPKIILPYNQASVGSKKENSLKATFAFHVCRRFHTNTTIPIYLHSDEQVFEFQMIITFGKYIIKSVNSETSKKMTSMFLAFFVIINTIAWLNLLVKTCRKNKTYSLKPRKKLDVFLTDERLKDRIIRYQAEIKLKMYENNPKPSDPKIQQVNKASPTLKKGFKLMPEDNMLNQFDYSNNIYPFIKSHKFNDNSCISEETFEKLFPNTSLNNSSDHETSPNIQRDQLFVNSYVVEEDEINKNYGTIGDQSLSNVNIIANETFNSKDRKIRKKSDNLSHEAFVNSIIIDHKLKQDLDDYDESSEDIEFYQDSEPISTLNQLDYAFGTNLIPKVKKGNILDSRKRSYTDYASSIKPDIEVSPPRASERKTPKTSSKGKLDNNLLKK